MDEIRDIAISTNESMVYAGTWAGEIFSYSQSGNITSEFSSCSGITSLSLSLNEGMIAAEYNQGDFSFQ